MVSPGAISPCNASMIPSPRYHNDTFNLCFEVVRLHQVIDQLLENKKSNEQVSNSQLFWLKQQHDKLLQQHKSLDDQQKEITPLQLRCNELQTELTSILSDKEALQYMARTLGDFIKRISDDNTEKADGLKAFQDIAAKELPTFPRPLSEEVRNEVTGLHNDVQRASRVLIGRLTASGHDRSQTYPLNAKQGKGQNRIGKSSAIKRHKTHGQEVRFRAASREASLQAEREAIRVAELRAGQEGTREEEAYKTPNEFFDPPSDDGE